MKTFCQHFSLFKLVFFSLSILFLFGCAQQTEEQEDIQDSPPQGQATGTLPHVSAPQGKTSETSPDSDDSTPSWVPDRPSNGPWNSDLYIGTSEDGLSFSNKELIIEHVGVPNLLLTSSGQIILVYQYFSYEDEDMFGVMAYSVSNDNGETWSEPALLDVEDLPPIETNPTMSEGVAFIDRAVDPTIVETEDGALRLYFTYHPDGDAFAHLVSATQSDGDVSGTFVYDNGDTPISDQNIVDPAAIYFDGVWHHYAPDHVAENDIYSNYHSTSEDGINFELQENIDLPMKFVGQVIAYEDGLRFYGGSRDMIAESSDGYTWEIIDNGVELVDSDPGIIQLDDGTYLMVATTPRSSS